MKDNYLKAVAYVWAVWCAHALLRFFFLVRNDSYGFPIVAKLDWYIFHAVCIDFIWIIIFTFPLLLTGILWWAGQSRLFKWMFISYIMFHSLVLLGTVVDHETYRLYGAHLSFNLLGTYGNKSSILEIITYLSQDQTWRYFPYVLFVSCIPCSGLFYAVLSRLLSSRRVNSIILILFAAVCWIFPNYIWGGGFRERKLTPLIYLAIKEFTAEKNLIVQEGEFRELVAGYQREWMREQGDSTWVFTSDSLPYLREAPASVPENRDSAGREAWNFVLIFLESHRAVNTGFLKPYGAWAGGTPFLDSLARTSHIWTRFNVAGLPTVSSLMTTHLSVLRHPRRYIATAFPLLRQKAFSVYLAEQGYRTHFFTSADPSWDNQTPWLRQWYQGYSYHRSRENDAEMFAHMGQWMRDSLHADRPFLVTAITKTNHYPFNTVKGMETHSPEDDMQTRMLKTMLYTEKALETLMRSIQDETWFSRTVFIILADHGFSLNEHGNGNLGWGLYAEHTWIPFLIHGAHPALGPPAEHHFPADQTDIGPTILALAGIRAPNHFTGHNLLRRGADSLNTAMVVHVEQGLLEAGNFRVHAATGEEPRIQGDELFDGINDRQELQNIIGRHRALFDSLSREMRRRTRLNCYVIENNLLW
jgi:phosphoglycerol transferase MdoB-like AlkP superfamily enzyme